jgi:hypothetical protein
MAPIRTFFATPARARLLAGLIALAAALAAPAAAQAGPPAVQVAKTATCGCCTAWIEHMEAHGWTVEAEDMAPSALVQLKLERGLRPELASCHTATVGGYVIEGHVPAEDVARLLEERPEAVGLAVPGMPIGSPGMEVGDRTEPYEVLLVRRDGSTEVFSRY